MSSSTWAAMTRSSAPIARRSIATAPTCMSKTPILPAAPGRPMPRTPWLDRRHRAGIGGFAAALQLPHQQQCQPAAHRRPDQNLRTEAAGVEHGKAVGEPAADRAVGECAAGFTVAGIVEQDAGAVGFLRPACKRRGFGAFHVRLVTGQPKESGRRPRLLAHCDAAVLASRSNFQEFQAVIVHLRGLDGREGGGRGHAVASPCFAENSAKTQGNMPHSR